VIPSPGTFLHRRLTTLLALIAVLAFVSGAGFTAPALIPAAALLLLGLVWNPPDRLRRRLELFWRALALLLALRAGYQALFVPTDLVLPMVDLLLLLVVAETFRAQDAAGEARLYALTFALLIAAAAYRPGALFGASFVAYLAVLTVTLMVGQLNRQARLRQLPQPRLPARFLAQSAALSAVALAVSVVVFLAFPRVSWGARAAPVSRTVTGFADRVSLLGHGSRIYPNPELVLRVEFPSGAAPPASERYWRGRSYDRFDGWTWSRTAARAHRMIETRQWPAERTEQLVYQATLRDANVLFGLSPLLDVRPRSRILPYREPNGDFTYGGSAEPVYTAVSVRGQPGAEALRSAAAAAAAGREEARGLAATAGVPAALRSYLRLPPLEPRVYALADSLAAAHANSYDRTIAVRDWLRDNLAYTLDLPATVAEASLDHFLFERRAGHCEYFSTAMAVLLRAVGIPARNVNGFLGGEWNEFGDFLAVTQNQAHSWVEVWFPSYGWVRFDPTPASVGALAAAAATPWWSSPGFLFADLEHRWSKWVLDYGLEDQGQLLRQLSEPFRPAEGAADAPAAVSWWRVVIAAMVLLLLAAALRSRASRTSDRPPSGAASRAYLRLRRAYARAGFPRQGPALTFLRQLELAQAPGMDAAGRAVRLYAQVRFGGKQLDVAGKRRLREDVLGVERLLRASRSRAPEVPR